MFSRKAFVIAFFLLVPQIDEAQEAALHIRTLKQTLFESGPWFPARL